MRKKSLQKVENLLEGSLWDKILFFAIPLAASSILQQLFNSADVAVVGHFAGNEALAAVGSNGPVINLIVNLFVGLSIGANVLTARLIGEKDEERISQAVHTSVLVAVLSGLFLAVLGFFISRPMLELMGAPDDVIDLAALYLKIYFLGMPFQMLYNFEAAILRSKGDTKRPLFCLLAAGVVNILLNLFFVIVMRMSVAGVAIATVISQIVSSGILLYLLLHEDGFLRLDLQKLRINKSILLTMAQIGVPAGLQGMVFSFSNVCIQSEINRLGSLTVAACSAALNFETFIYYVVNAFGQASVTFIGQNYGAMKLDRCVKSVRWCLLLGGVFTVCMSGAILLFADTLIFFYTPDKAVAEIAVVRMRCVIVWELFSLAMDVFSGSMRGYGYSLIPAIISIIGACGLRVLWVYTIYRANPGFVRLMIIYPISWAATAASDAIAYFIIKRRVLIRSRCA